MKLFRRTRFPQLSGLFIGLIFAVGSLHGFAAATLNQQIEPQEANVGDEVTITFTIQGGGATNIQLPPVSGLHVAGNSTSSNITFDNGVISSSISQGITVIPDHAGDFTIPAFDIHTADGQVLHTHPMSLHVVNSGAPSSNANISNIPNIPAPFGGPVITPPQTSQAPDDSATANGADNGASSIINAPMDSDGRPAKVFLIITPTTTDAYVGQTIPLRIEFYIRMDVLAQQDSLPTIKGSDFLMNDLTTRGEEDEVTVKDEPYRRSTWNTAISGPKTGDYVLQMEQDTYWAKNAGGLFMNPLGNFFGQPPQLAHQNIPSNQLTIHVHPLPDEDRPPDFSGAIGQFKAAGNAFPTSVNVGEPVYLDFSISGQGNFDRVKSPVLSLGSDWKTYVPSSKINFIDESHTQGEKTFHQAIIPQKNGTLALPPASFSYFDPGTKKYVTLPINLPSIVVTGTPVTPVAPAPADQGGSSVNSVAAAPGVSDLLPNRLELGFTRMNIAPVYRQPWYWLLQGVLLLLLGLAGLFVFLRRGSSDEAKADRIRHLRSVQEAESAMNAAVQQDDAPAFFLAARQAVQLRLGEQWHLPPGAITLPLITSRDPALAENLAPLFAQADEVRYSGHTPGGLDLAEWNRRVRGEISQPQPA
jgi:hypothetical protein